MYTVSGGPVIRRTHVDRWCLDEVGRDDSERPFRVGAAIIIDGLSTGPQLHGLCWRPC